MSDDESLPGMIYYAKARPHEFVWATRVLSERNIALGGRGFSLFPLRRSAVPKHIHLDCDIVAVLDPNMSIPQADKLAVEQVKTLRTGEVGVSGDGVDILDPQARKQILARRHRFREPEANLAVTRDVVLPAFQELDQPEAPCGA